MGKFFQVWVLSILSIFDNSDKKREKNSLPDILITLILTGLVYGLVENKIWKINNSTPELQIEDVNDNENKIKIDGE